MENEQLSLVLYTEKTKLTCFISIPHDLRLSDVLNEGLAGECRYGGSFLDLTGVTIFGEGNFKERYTNLYIAKSTLHMVETPDGDVARGIGAKVGRKRHPFVRKSPMYVRLQLPNYTLTGNIHGASGQSVLDILNSELMFLPLTDAKMKEEGSDRWRSVAFLAVNRKEILSAHKITAS